MTTLDESQNSLPKLSQNALARFNDVYSTYWSDLCGFLHAKFGSGPPDPEDIAQTTFIKYAEMGEGQRVDNPKAFLFRAASNLIIDYHRSPKNVQATEDDINSLENKKSSDVSNPELVLMSRQEMNIVEEVLMTLSERDRAFVLMNRLDNMTYTEIAKEAGMSRSGVQKIILQALEKCEKALKRSTLS